MLPTSFKLISFWIVKMKTWKMIVNFHCLRLLMRQTINKSKRQKIRYAKLANKTFCSFFKVRTDVISTRRHVNKSNKQNENKLLSLWIACEFVLVSKWVCGSKKTTFSREFRELAESSARQCRHLQLIQSHWTKSFEETSRALNGRKRLTVSNFWLTFDSVHDKQIS